MRSNGPFFFSLSSNPSRFMMILCTSCAVDETECKKEEEYMLLLLLLLGDRFTEGLISGQRQRLRAPVRHHSYWHLLPKPTPKRAWTPRGTYSQKAERSMHVFTESSKQHAHVTESKSVECVFTWSTEIMNDFLVSIRGTTFLWYSACPITGTCIKILLGIACLVSAALGYEVQRNSQAYLSTTHVFAVYGFDLVCVVW